MVNVADVIYELEQVIYELENIAKDIESEFNGVGEVDCAMSLRFCANKYRQVLNQIPVTTK